MARNRRGDFQNQSRRGSIVKGICFWYLRLVFSFLLDGYHSWAMLSKDTSGASRILSNGIIRKCIAAVYIPKYVSVHWVYIILCFWKVYVSYICFTTRSSQYPDWCCFRKRRMKANNKQWGKQIRTYQNQTLYTCDVSSAVHIHFIRDALEAS